MDLESKDIKKQKLDELKNIFPEIVTDEKIDYEKLKDILDEVIEESKTEHYSFNWNGKKECYKIIKQKSNATLKVDTDKNIPDGDNVFIEGDNLEVLKLLQTSYHKKVKMIYIDPPYNKDKDFVYSDTWGDTIKNYQIQTDQLRDEGYTTTKTNSTGRRHTNWLNMIYPRLWLSRNLLKDDGVIFVSIDDDEVHNLRKVMDEIYGEENFVGSLKWKRKKQPSYLHGQIAKVMEYILVYAKNINNLEKLSIEQRTDTNTRLDNGSNALSERLIKKGVRVKLPDDILIIEKGIYKNKTMSTEYMSDVIIKNGITQNDVTVKAQFRNKQEDIDTFIDENVLFITKNYGFRRDLLEIEKEKRKSITDLLIDWGDNQDSDKELVELFGENKPFDYSKPSLLIKNLVKSLDMDNDIILDFFAGSGTTAQAVMELNQEDNGNRKYILVQLPEATEEKSEAYKNGYKKISDITKERIKRVIDKLDYKDGFKSYYLDKSNFQVFSELKKRPNDSFEEIMNMLKMSVFNRNIFTQGARELDIVYEVGLKNGFTLSAQYDDTLKLGEYSFIKLSEEQREFYFCFEDKIGLDIQKTLPKDAKLICYDKALDDNTKLNLRQNIDLETL